MTKEAGVSVRRTCDETVNDFLFLLRTELVEVRVDQEGQQRLVAAVVVLALPLVTGPDLVQQREDLLRDFPLFFELLLGVQEDLVALLEEVFEDVGFGLHKVQVEQHLLLFLEGFA